MIIGDDFIGKIYSKRNEDAKKYDHGSVFVIGGSQIYSGSPAITALSAMRAGADVAHIAAPERSADIAASFSPDIITHPLKGVSLTLNHLPKLLEITESLKSASRGNLAVVIGGGMGRREESKRLVREYVKNADVPIIIDADGIYAFENDGEELLGENCLFTPHLYEFYILTGRNIDNLSRDEKSKKVKESAAEMGIVIALKGSEDVISDGSKVLINDLSVPELTAGGCGDTLAGIAGAIASRKNDMLKAGAAACYINTRAGKIAANKYGESLISEDLINSLPDAIKSF